MPYQEFIDIISILNDALVNEFKDKMTLHSFGAWQIIETLKGMFGEDNTSLNFTEYVRKLGLLDNDKPTKQQIQMEKQIALRNAEEILKLHRQQGAS